MMRILFVYSSIAFTLNVKAHNQFVSVDTYEFKNDRYRGVVDMWSCSVQEVFICICIYIYRERDILKLFYPIFI